MKLRGFTLIEMLVSVAIFSIVMVMALGALLALSSADRKAQTLKSAIDNLNFAMEDMSRSIRTGSSYHCSAPNQTGDCFAGTNTMYFTSNTGIVTGYKLSTDPAVCGVQTPTTGCIARSTDSGASWAAITAPDVIICDLSTSPSTNCPQIANPFASYLFYIQGTASGSGDSKQPMVIMTVSGYAQVTATQKSSFHMQTTIAQRIYDQ